MLVHIFGAKSSPSVAGYALRKTAKGNEQDFSAEVVDAVFRDFYVDDLLKSFADAERAVDLSGQLRDLLAKGGFQLTKWISNRHDVLPAFPVEERAPQIKDLDLKSDSLPLDRALGIHWDVEHDIINFVFGKGEQPENRKGVLSSISTVYDPLGFASPLLLPGRKINQELCKMKFSWTDTLPEELCLRWRKWKEDLMSLQDFNIPRCLKPEGFGRLTRAELHHFADASQEHGYGTVSYLRLINDQRNIHCSFVMGKSRVKLLNGAVTVPKLELAVATLATRINKVVTKELEERLTIDSVTYWTDSMIVLKYIANENRRFVTFVANRVTVIRQESEPSQWRHIGAHRNSKTNVKFSPTPLTVIDVTEAEKKIVKAVQAQSFPVETDKTVLTGQLARLKPFEDEGILRVGGRLKHSELQYDAKYTMILPGKHQVTRLIVLHYHHLNGHVGSHQVLAEIRQRFWIVKGVSSVKRVLSKCHVCKRQSAKLGEQMTAQLLVVRVSSDSDRIIYPFAAVGLEYSGTLYVKTGPKTRSKKNATLNKRYGCIFNCLRYREVHIEVAEDLSTDSFINAVLRFVGRRGPPRIIFSDNGTNFRGAELDVIKALQVWDQENIKTTLTRRGIDWKFNPPAASIFIS
ncbi:PREDICTED: uncharacterized protein LOC107334302 [Acropora digitifera]|uniref:uncharacterized protein LOC107334302 n=1 Tax=Acropora digitifera TaxID=70779 RepID=UPI00077B1F1A|nr:PREDICTED: uncharacterized protein LOC107334302 [Acropora digitifera]